MGRQILIAMHPDDEARFLAHLRETADIALYRSWSPEPLAVDRFSEDRAASPFYINNRAFPWTPAFERVTYRDEATGEPSTYYRLESRHAPLIEYSRHPMAAPKPEVSGRLYWAKLFLSQHNELGYDLASFDRWFDGVARWIRANGKRVRHGATEPWCLPVARQVLQNEA